MDSVPANLGQPDLNASEEFPATPLLLDALVFLRLADRDRVARQRRDSGDPTGGAKRQTPLHSVPALPPDLARGGRTGTFYWLEPDSARPN